MMALVTKEQAKKHCRVSSSAEDELIDLYVKASESAALAYMNRKVYLTLDELELAVLDGSAGIEPTLVTDDMRLAILLMVGHFYSNREQNVAGTIVSELRLGSKKLLEPYRIVPGV